MRVLKWSTSGAARAVVATAVLAPALVLAPSASGPATGPRPVAAAQAVPAVPSAARSVARSAPRGRADDYSWLVKGARWDACRPITVAVNRRALTRQRRAFDRELAWAMRQVTRASGLRFRIVGTTTAVPQPGTTNPAGVDVVVAWARPGQSRWLSDRRYLGYAGATATGTRLGNGFVVLNAAQKHTYPASRYRGDRRAWHRRMTVLHELSHAVGAGHARSRTQVMYPELAGKARRFGRGDLTIMRALGADRAACS